MSDLECVHINGHKFIGSKSARNMFTVEYIPKPSKNDRETNQFVLLAKDVSEVTKILDYPEFSSKIGKICEIKDIGTCLDMELIHLSKAAQKNRFEDIK
jgi:hypothetical protein